MGTNYYHRTHICEHCDRFDEHHIGKSSGGWTFGFHGEREEDSELNSLGRVVASFDDWKLLFLEEGSKIIDEYGEEISVAEFIQMVEKKKSETLNHTEYCKVAHPSLKPINWLDNEGNSFSEGEFS